MELRDRKLGREKAAGLCWEDGTLEIESRLVSWDRLEIILHEALHHLCPEKPESWVARNAKRMRRLMWNDRWRRIER